MGRRVGAKRAGRASARRKKGSSLLRTRAPRQLELLSREGGGGGGGGGGGDGGGSAFPIWRRWLTSPEDVAQPARGGAGRGGTGGRRKRRAGTWRRGRRWGSAHYDPFLGPGVSAGASRQARGPPPVDRDVSSLRPPPPSPLEKSGLQPETGEAPHEWGSRGLGEGGPRSASRHALTFPDTTILGVGRGRGERRGGGREGSGHRLGVWGTQEGFCSPLMERGENSLSAHAP